jgi:hypothetical protein
MSDDARAASQGCRLGRLLLALGFFAAGQVDSLLPRGAFGAHDVAIRAAITGASGVAVALTILVVSRWWNGSS